MLLLVGQSEFLQSRLDQIDPCQIYQTCPIFLLPMPSQLLNHFRPQLIQPSSTLTVDLIQLWGRFWFQFLYPFLKKDLYTKPNQVFPSKPGIPEPDLLVRVSFSRSNWYDFGFSSYNRGLKWFKFDLWMVAYRGICVLNRIWPDSRPL